MNISNLPTNNSYPLSPEDIRLATHIFGEKSVNPKQVSNFLKTPVLVAFIVGFMLHPMSDTLVNKIYNSDSKHITILVKMVISAVIFFILNNWALSRK